MSTSFTTDLIAGLSVQIDDLTKDIEILTEELTKLQLAREALSTDEVEVPKKSTAKKAETKGAPTDPDELYAWRVANLKKARDARAAKAKGKKTRAQEILDLLDGGMSPAEVAEHLGISKGYVYNTRNRAEAAVA
jgi:DNA-binding CsgD family transcriptional regulator